MNILGHQNRLGAYRKVNDVAFGIPLCHRSESETEHFVKTSVSWKWHKGSRVSTINDWLQIRIGGDDDVKEKKHRQTTNRIVSTKYTFLTFLPQNLFEQFQRIANFYFLVMTIISIMIDSPVSPMTSLLPLVFVISVTAAKQGYEDFLRYKTDNIVNCSPVTVIRNGNEENIESQYIQPGDLVLVERDCDVPCDLVLLNSSDPHGKCFITTANLDGESNLKCLVVPKGLPKVDIGQLNTLGVIECESAKTDLYSFNGKLELSGADGKILPLSAENILLRGCRVKNTECVIGCAVYTGMSTKLQLNSKLTSNKSASSEMYINRFLIFILLSLIAIVTTLFFLKRYNELFVIPNLVYLGPAADGYSVRQFLQDYLSFLILFNYLIPISLYVTIEMYRVLGGLFMEWDLHLYDEGTDQPCIVNTSNLNEELGQINILFSDKTGTLTKNEMIFQHCSIAGRKFKYKRTRLEDLISGHDLDINKFNKEQNKFFQALAICHTVQVANTNNIDKEIMKNGQGDAVKEDLQQIYSISDITEESQNSSQHSDVNCMEISSFTDPYAEKPLQLSGTTASDSNALLSEASKYEKRKKPQVTKRSPNFTRPTARIHPLTRPSGLEAISNYDRERSLILPNSTTYKTNIRPISMEFKRSNSQMHLTAVMDGGGGGGHQVVSHGHRRSQSYGTPGMYTGQRMTIGGINFIHRTSSNASRESYAAPTFQRQPTILIREESQRRKNKIQQAVQVLDYQAASPDEKALIEACAHLGLVYIGDDDEILKLRLVPPHMDYTKPQSLDAFQEIRFNRLHILEFTSDRKRMSVIIKDENGGKWIYTKGAETSVFPLCGAGSSDMVAKTNLHIHEFSQLGLRTLAVACKQLTDAEYEVFLKDLHQANIALDKRRELFDNCYNKIENNLELLGATAVEDALQDNVQDTLVTLQKAGIKIWVLTGDKIETALNIALACGHIPRDALKYFITNCTVKEDMLLHLNILTREIVFGMGRECALLIDGISLGIALRETSTEFRDVSIKCIAVLCCRLSPLQKSEVVALMKTVSENINTAAIGDGANDVSMIQEAHVGIGIVGKEGRQAARCADFAMAKFSMLKRLLLVHGHYHSARLSKLVLYFFYKNILFMGIMFLFQFHTLFSSSSVYDSLFLTLYNVMYTSMPILFISLTEKPYTETVLLSKSELYGRNTNNKRLHWPYFFAWVTNAVYHSLVCFYFVFHIFNTNNVILSRGQTAEYSCFGTLLMQLIVIVSNLKLSLESKYLSYWFMLIIIFSILSFTTTTFVYNIIDIRYDTDIYWVYNKLLSSFPVWLLCILAVVTCLLPDFTHRMAKRGLNLPQISIFPSRERLRLLRPQAKTEITHL